MEVSVNRDGRNYTQKYFRGTPKEQIGIFSDTNEETGTTIKFKPDETIFIPLGSIHRIENPYKKPVRIIEAQVGSILKESDIVRYEDIYGRVK